MKLEKPQREASELEGRIDSFINRLRSYAREGHEDRAALAALRSGLRGQPDQAPAADRYVMPSLREEKEHRDKWFYLVGALFAWHPNTRRFKRKKSLGASLAELRGDSGDMIDAFYAPYAKAEAIVSAVTGAVTGAV